LGAGGVSNGHCCIERDQGWTPLGSCPDRRWTRLSG
jgi:hypothetical protein